MTALDRSFRCMGSEMRLILDALDGDAPLERLFSEVTAELASFDERLSRFRAGSELSRLNADAGTSVPASDLLRAVVRAALWAANRSGGLVDPTLVAPLEELGYSESWPLPSAAPLRKALAAAPPRRPARPAGSPAWRSVEVDDAAGSVERAPGVRIDSGGVGKGLAADVAALRLAALPRFLVDCGGDIAVGGTAVAAHPFEIAVEHPLDGGVAHTLRMARGGVATSGIGRRVWRRDGGGFAHHLIDPSTGEPAWTGLVSATAVAASALEAETIAKAALLSGPLRARRLIAAGGGVLVHDSGDVDVLRPGARVRVRGRRLEASAR